MAQKGLFDYYYYDYDYYYHRRRRQYLHFNVIGSSLHETQAGRLEKTH
jgi:hypothetical protein